MVRDGHFAVFGIYADVSSCCFVLRLILLLAKDHVRLVDPKTITARGGSYHRRYEVLFHKEKLASGPLSYATFVS